MKRGVSRELNVEVKFGRPRLRLIWQKEDFSKSVLSDNGFEDLTFERLKARTLKKESIEEKIGRLGCSNILVCTWRLVLRTIQVLKLNSEQKKQLANSHFLIIQIIHYFEKNHYFKRYSTHLVFVIPSFILKMSINDKSNCQYKTSLLFDIIWMGRLPGIKLTSDVSIDNTKW